MSNEAQFTACVRDVYNMVLDGLAEGYGRNPDSGDLLKSIDNEGNAEFILDCVEVLAKDRGIVSSGECGNRGTLRRYVLQSGFPAALADAEETLDAHLSFFALKLFFSKQHSLYGNRATVALIECHKKSLVLWKLNLEKYCNELEAEM